MSPPLSQASGALPGCAHHAPPRGAEGRDELWRRNRATLSAEHQAGQIVLAGRPAHLKIELTNYCNLACPMCPHPHMRRAVGYMRPDLFRRIVDQAAPHLEFAYLHHLGESLFHGQLPALVRYGRERGVRLGLSTNANFLSLKKGRALIDSGLDFLVISLDGASAGSYQHMRQGGDFHRTVDQVRRFLEMVRALEKGPEVVVQMILSSHNHHEVEDFARQWAGQVVIKQARDWAGQVRLGPEFRPRGPGSTPGPAPVSDPCRMPWTELTVLWDGAVVPCANVFERHHLLGDLQHQTLDEVWNGAPLQGLRRAHVADRVRDVPVCATCPRHRLDAADFVAVDQLAQRLRHYRAAAALSPDQALRPRPGLS